MKEKDDGIRCLPETDATRMTVGDECSHTCFYWGQRARELQGGLGRTSMVCRMGPPFRYSRIECVYKDDMTIID